MSLVTLLPFIVLIGAMFLMTRSTKRKQQQQVQMRDQMQPGSGVRTIGGMYATVKEVHEETVLLEVDAGTHAIFAKNAIGAVLADEEYNRIVHGAEEVLDSPIVPDDASSLTEADDTDGAVGSSDDSRVDLGRRDPAGTARDAGTADEPADAGTDDDDPEAKDASLVEAADDAADAESKKTDGESGAK